MKSLSQNIFRYRIYQLAGLLIFSTLIACEDTPDEAAIQALILEKLEERVANYTSIKNKKCLDRVLEEANRRADSILLIEARLDRDTFFKPPKPEKPEKPEILTLGDSTPVEPFLRSTVDSLVKGDSIY